MKRILIVALTLLLFCGTGVAYGAEAAEPNAGVGDDLLSAQSDALELDKLQRSAGEYGSGLDLEKGISLDDGLQQLLDTGSEQLNGVVRKALHSAVLILVIILFGGLAGHLCGDLGEKNLSVVRIAVTLAITVVAVSDANSLMHLGRDAISGMQTFANILLPTITATTAAMGAPLGATARQLATLLFSDVLINLIDHLLLPLVYAYLAACAGYAVLGNDGLKRIAKLLKSVVTGVLTTVLVIFVGYLTVSGAIAGSTDAMTVKATKFAMTSMVPVVGKILSDAAETVLAGTGILRGTVGVFGMLVVLGILLTPFLQLGIHYLAYKVSAAVGGTVADGRTASLIDGIGGAFGLVLGMTGACGVLLLISIVSAITVVVR